MSQPLPRDAKRRIHQVLLIADLAGAEHFHVGDEAMLECNLLMLRRLLPLASFSLMSRDPQMSTRLYGARAIARPGFASVSADRQVELRKIDAWLALAKHHTEQLPEVMQVLLQADLLVISGGGNLSSNWPEYILERLALVRLARQQGIAVLVLGQTLGPQLSEIDRDLVAEILDAATWVGVREARSAALALDLGVPLAHIDYQLDDATTLLPTPTGLLASAWPETQSTGPVIALTLHPLFVGATRDRWLDSVAEQLDRVIAELGARLLFLPHLCDRQGDQDVGDQVIGHALAARLQQPEALCVLAVQSSGETAWLTQQADLVVSSRYHPIVFALAQQRPCLGLATDQYTLTKLQGALNHAGRESDLLVICEQQWHGLAQRIIARYRQTAPPWRPVHAYNREERLGAWLEKLQQGTQVTAGGATQTELLLALARLVGLAEKWLIAAREAELEDIAGHWKETAKESKIFVHDLQAALYETGNRAERAEIYARSLEIERETHTINTEDIAKINALDELHKFN